MGRPCCGTFGHARGSYNDKQRDAGVASSTCRISGRGYSTDEERDLMEKKGDMTNPVLV